MRWNIPVWKNTFLFSVLFLLITLEAQASCPSGYTSMPMDIIENNGMSDNKCVKAIILNACAYKTNGGGKTSYDVCIVGYDHADQQGQLDNDAGFNQTLEEMSMSMDKPKSGSTSAGSKNSSDQQNASGEGDCHAKADGTALGSRLFEACMKNKGNAESSTADNDNAPVRGCDLAYQELARACTDKASLATTRCDENADTGMMKWSRNIETTMQLAQGATSQMGINTACDQVNKAMMGANTAIAAFNSLCEYNISSCHSACSKALNDAQAKGCMDVQFVQTSIQSCNQLKTKAQKIGNSLQALTQNAAMAKTCAGQTAGTFSRTDSTNCSLPENANNMVCKCQKNPYSPECNAGTTSTGTGNEMAQASQIDRANNKNIDLGSLPFNEPQAPGAPGNRAAQDLSGAGKQGGGANLNISGGGSGGGGGSEGGVGGSGISANILSGFRGGSTSGSGSRGSNNYGSAAGGGNYGGGRGGSVGTGQPDLRQFLPGGSMYKRRGISGSYAGPDGITGPHGNIWQKVNTRYKILQNSLLP